MQGLDMAIRHTSPYRPKKPMNIACMECGNQQATVSMSITFDRGADLIHVYYCEKCFGNRPWLNMYEPPKEPAKSVYGVTNGDTRSLTPSSIPRWGIKIKARRNKHTK